MAKTQQSTKTTSWDYALPRHEICAWYPSSSPPKVLIGGPVREFAGIPVKACGNDETELPALIQHLRRSHLDGRLLLFGFGQVAVSSLLAPCFGFRVCASDLFIRLPKALLAEWNRGQLLLWRRREGFWSASWLRPRAHDRFSPSHERVHLRLGLLAMTLVNVVMLGE